MFLFNSNCRLCFGFSFFLIVASNVNASRIDDELQFQMDGDFSGPPAVIKLPQVQSRNAHENVHGEGHQDRSTFSKGSIGSYRPYDTGHTSSFLAGDWLMRPQELSSDMPSDDEVLFDQARHSADATIVHSIVETPNGSKGEKIDSNEVSGSPDHHAQELIFRMDGFDAEESSEEASSRQKVPVEDARDTTSTRPQSPRVQHRSMQELQAAIYAVTYGGMRLVVRDGKEILVSLDEEFSDE